MTQLTADKALQAALERLHEFTEIRDTSGEVIGYYAPAGAQGKMLAYQNAAAHFDPEEMVRRKNSLSPYFSTEEVLEHLRSLGGS